ncbi:phenylalanine--tRNA ligase subunit beta [soil metagenome]
MNIKITYNWLLEYLDTDATPADMQKYLSLSGPSIETVEKIDDSTKGGLTDYVFDIEVTSNRIDMASVFGIAQEAQAILPQHGFKAKLKENPLQKYTFENLKAEPNHHKNLQIIIENPDLCPRFTAIIFSNITIQPVSPVIKKRLEMVDIKSINNIIDISNYLMVSLGQPTHMFDYDKIEGAKMIVRESKKGEKLKTLDDREFILPGGDIVIEDGSGTLMDLCGIMGGLNSSITSETKTVVFFVQTYDKRKIRKTSMLTGQRTQAATYFEKGLDPKRVETTLVYGVDLMNEMSCGIVDSPLYDIYPRPRKEKEVHTYLSDIQRVMGIPIEEKKVISILENLGFKVARSEDPELAYPDGVKFKVTVPTFRTDDVAIKEDIAEEVARVYGYGNLPSNIAPIVYLKQPHEIERLFTLQNKTKLLLKHLGLHEVMNYSMISENLIDNLGLTKKDHLKLANTISKEIEYLRLSLLPSLAMNMKENQGKKDMLKFFEIAKVYPKRENDLPNEQYKLAIAVDTDFYDLKGILETIFSDYHIDTFAFKPGNDSFFAPQIQAQIIDTKTNKQIGTIGRLQRNSKEKMEINNDMYLAEIDFSFITEHYRTVEAYKEPLQYAVIKLDMNVTINEKSFDEICNEAKIASTLLIQTEYISSYKDSYTIRFYFSSPDRNITDAEAKKELENIIKKISV